MEDIPTPQGVIVTRAHDTSPSGIPGRRGHGFIVGILTAKSTAPLF